MQLSFWLLDAGHVRGVLTDAQYAEKRAYFALDMRRTAAIDADLPSADDLVRACLQAIQVSPEQAAIRQATQDLASIDAGLMKASRQAKTLVSAAQWHLDLVADEQLADQLRDWIRVRPRLVKQHGPRQISVLEDSSRRVRVRRPRSRLAATPSEVSCLLTVGRIGVGRAC